jgi:glycerophosphoryl diester phosphodiesterase
MEFLCAPAGAEGCALASSTEKSVLVTFRGLSFLAAFLCVAVNGPAMAFDIEAHRGGRALFPENTLQSFANALSMGVDTLELDMGVTKDGVIVVSHERGLNPDLARGPDGTYVAPPGIPFVRLRLEEVKKYDVGQIRPGSAYAAQFPEQRAVPGTPIPTLSEVFALVRKSGDDHVRLNIETKIDPHHPDESPGPERFITRVLDLLEAEKFTGRVMIQSFDWRTLQLAQKRAPAIPTVYLSQQQGSAPTVFPDKPSPWTAGFDPKDYGNSLPRAIKAAGGAIWSPFFRDVDRDLVAESHRLGLTVVVWTVNKPEDMGSSTWAWTASSPTVRICCAASPARRASRCPRGGRSLLEARLAADDAAAPAKC